eukprot:846267-Pyramimonas_sp.AAC.1
MPLKGGLRQRLGAAPLRQTVDPPSCDVGSSIDAVISKRFKSGQCSAVEAVEVLGASGSSSFGACSSGNQKNAHRDYVRKLHSQSKSPDVYEFQITLWDQASNAKYTDKAYMLLPFEVCDYLMDDPAAWQHLPLDSPLYMDRQAWGRRLSPAMDDARL